MADFDKYFPTLLSFEGGFVNDPADLGGATNKGITMKTFMAQAPKLLGIASPTLNDLKALTDEQAKRIYKTCYWDAVHGDEIEFQLLAEIIFDFYVNAGAPAVRQLQHVLNDLSTTPCLPADGVIGKNTLIMLKKIDQHVVYTMYKHWRINYYRNLVAARPSMQKYLKGWLNRVNSFPDLQTA